MSNSKVIIQKLASIIGQQQKILDKLAQQVVDTSKPASDPMGKLVHDATAAWSQKSGMSARSTFSAGIDGKSYDVEVVLTITDPKKPAPLAMEGFKQQLLSILQGMFASAAKDPASPLSGCTATFTVK
jgi:hypothetical protein